MHITRPQITIFNDLESKTEIYLAKEIEVAQSKIAKL